MRGRGRPSEAFSFGGQICYVAFAMNCYSLLERANTYFRYCTAQYDLWTRGNYEHARRAIDF